MPRTRNTARRRPARARLITPLFALALLGGSLVSCGGDSAADEGRGNAGDPSSVTLRIGATGWSRDEAALKIAGLDDTPYSVEWNVFAGGDQQLQAMRAGALDLALTSEIPPVFTAAEGDPGFQVVAVQHSATLLQEVVAPEGSDLTGIDQLAGRTVGYVENTTAQYFLYELLKNEGLDWSDIDAAPLAPDQAVAALNGGSVDAFAGYGSAIIAAHQGGAATIGSGADILSGNFPWIATEDAIGDPATRSAIADLLGRIDRANAHLRDGHQQEIAEATAAATRQPVELALQTIEDQEAQRPTEIVPTGQEAIDSQQRVADTFLELGALREPLDVTTFWTDALNEELTEALEGGEL